jgi:hypothetical protein
MNPDRTALIASGVALVGVIAGFFAALHFAGTPKTRGR